MASEGICKLCLSPADLQRSHILPEFVYRPFYDEKHRAFRFNRGSSDWNYLQKGFREPMLCRACEQFLNDHYEKPVKAVWYDGGALPETVPQAEIRLTNLPMPAFQLFHLSVLWRASVSTLDVFSKVRLGPYEDIVRRLIYGSDVDAPSCSISATVLRLPSDGAPATALFTQPFRARFADQIASIFVFGGCVWHYIVGNRRPAVLADYELAPDGTMVLPVLDLDEFTPLSDLIRSRRYGRAAASGGAGITAHGAARHAR